MNFDQAFQRLIGFEVGYTNKHGHHRGRVIAALAGGLIKG
jgi:hypothetical protein